MKNHFFLLAPGKILYYMIQNTAGTKYNVDLFCPTYNIKNKLLKTINKLQFNSKISVLYHVIPNSYWARFHVLNEIKLDDKENNIVVLTIGIKTNKEINTGVFDDYKKAGVKLVLMMFDSIESMPKQDQETVIKLFDYFDLVMTFDKDDADRFHLQHFSLPYDKELWNVDDNGFVINDLMFVGNDKGRRQLIEKIAQKTDEHRVSTDFTLVNTKSVINRIDDKSKIKRLNHTMEYTSIVEKILKSNCILEVLCKGQKTASLRYYEAVVYNKKLLTNNKNAVNLPYYDPRFIQIFDDIESIDFSWVTRREKVDYRYKGDFSSELLLTSIVDGLGL